ncbi:glycosyltransferase [Winogradskyella bathintestinalis]|uniref:Glycosyltransferase n=1 Tax=Winogradskyella bathintestinalis TaxID=3035208 RepID=A0ABT7ZUF7_9FLAO|nr:glycosyltransferase [Winogradskyella bathintestinalis]MDN3492599.1 glycosyltransferase [Winogradskyella bathintestinalis]
MNNPVRKKICIVVRSLAGGGAERSAGLLSIMLSEIGHDVHVVSVLNDIKYPYAGDLLNLGIIKERNSKLVGGLKRFKALYKYIRQHNFDFLIDNRPRVNKLQEYVVAKFLYKPNRTIYCVRSFNLYNYMPTNALMARIWYGNAYRIVSVSETISKKLKNQYHLNNVITIHNPTDIASTTILSKPKIHGDYILYFGRLVDDVKNVSLLLEAFEKSHLYKAKVKLVIMGEGKDRTTLEKKVAMLNCKEYVEFIGYNPHPNSVIAHAKYAVLTSHYEGFPRILLESLSLGIPVVSVDCNSGPSEIIKNGENGLLVENYNTPALALAMDTLYFDNALYQKCKENAKRSVLKFNQDNIAKQWQKILN